MMTTYLFYVFSAAAIFFSLLVVTLRHPMASAFSLVVSFFFVSGLFILLSAPFLGVIQILIYAGAILVLFLYVIMLLNLKPEEEGPDLSRRRRRRIVRLLLVPALFLGLWFGADVPAFYMSEVAPQFGSIESVGEIFLGNYVFWFEALSLILLVAILGVVAISGKREDLST